MAYSSFNSFSGRVATPMSYGTTYAGNTTSPVTYAGNIAAPVSYSTATAGRSIAGARTVGAQYASTVAAPTYSSPVTYTSAAPSFVETITPGGAFIEEFVRPAVAERNLLAMGNVVSERVISIEELAAEDRYAQADAVNVGIIAASPAPVIYESMAAPPAPVIYETMAAAPIGYETFAAPVSYETFGAPMAYEALGAPMTYETFGAPMAYEALGAPMTYIA